MSNPDQPSTPPLTRRQMRDLRNTGSTPIQNPQDAPATAPEPKPEPAAPLPRAAAPAVVPPAPRADASVDLGVSPLTRRQAREQERIRTASVPVISPDTAADAATPTVKPAEQDSSGTDTGGMTALFTPNADERPADETPLAAAEAALADEPAPVVSPQLGSALLESGVPEVALPPSFDHLLTREGSTGSIATPNALILSQTPSADAFTSPIAATGEVLITGTFALPEGLGSRGHAPGTTDGKEADAVLVDGELPPASSPTPIAASAAISTIKSADEIIRPPAPEKGSRLMLVLAITAGALALALVGVLVFAVSTGLFS
ncbi:hypothetical protein [Microbacterium sp. Clip185]|uniref:hypothetical protein n=1 Tax=Microbacterium sp. Clip185 TaxID=3025663 RepID=UPI0023663517|nr:hypothetical protein [Microbacterium sp. Clip185]WDG19423.1 hypothetical protein PQV94_06695 [Microbacterium sp. Clip185]